MRKRLEKEAGSTKKGEGVERNVEVEIHGARNVSNILCTLLHIQGYRNYHELSSVLLYFNCKVNGKDMER